MSDGEGGDGGSPLPTSPIFDGGGEVSEPRVQERGAGTCSRNERWSSRRRGSPLPTSPIFDGGGEVSEPRVQERGAGTCSRNERWSSRRRGSPLPTSPIFDGGREREDPPLPLPQVGGVQKRRPAPGLPHLRWGRRKKPLVGEGFLKRVRWRV